MIESTYQPVTEESARRFAEVLRDAGSRQNAAEIIETTNVHDLERAVDLLLTRGRRGPGAIKDLVVLMRIRETRAFERGKAEA